MRFYACLLIFAVGCGSCNDSDASAPAEGATSTNANASSPNADQEPALRPFPEPWNPSEALDLEGVTLRTLYVTSEASAVCPTREEAQARSCGDSEEFVGQGLSLRPGDSVDVVGDAPFDGHWRAIRYQLEGPLPSWIRADDLGEEPSRANLEALEARPEFIDATPIDELDAEAIQRLEGGTFVRFTRKREIRLAGTGSVGEHERGIFLYVPVGDVPVAVRLREGEEGEWMYNHGGLVYHGSMVLDYRCREGRYCDEVSILAFVTPARTAPPEDPSDDWPPEWGEADMPVLVGVALADRFGVYEFEVPEWAATWRQDSP